jgi:hypothetical protein
VRRTLPDARLLVPRSGTAALVELLDLEPPLRVGDADVVVVWLDRIERYLGTEQGLDAKLLGRLRALAPRVVLMGTTESNVREYLLHADGRVGPTARLVLEQAATVVLPDDFAVRSEARIEPFGTESPETEKSPVAGSPAMLHRWQDGLRAASDAEAASTAGLGAMLVRAAVDWRRMGMFRPITEVELRELTWVSPEYQASNFYGALWADAMRWALTEPPGTTEPMNATEALLEEVNPPGATATERVFRASAFLVSLGNCRNRSQCGPIRRRRLGATAGFAQPRWCHRRLRRFPARQRAAATWRHGGLS